MSGGQKGTTKEAHLPPPLNRFKYRVLPLSRGFTHMGCCNGATVPRKISLTLWNFGRNPPQTAENAPVQIGVGVSLEFDSHGASAAVSRSVLRYFAVTLDAGARRLRPPAPGSGQSLSDWPNNRRVRHALAPASTSGSFPPCPRERSPHGRDTPASRARCAFRPPGRYPQPS